MKGELKTIFKSYFSYSVTSVKLGECQTEKGTIEAPVAEKSLCFVPVSSKDVDLDPTFS